MRCECVERIKKNALEKLQNEQPYKKPVESLRFKEMLLSLAGGVPEEFTCNTLEITLDGQKKKEMISVAHKYCPFCGIKTKEDD